MSTAMLAPGDINSTSALALALDAYRPVKPYRRYSDGAGDVPGMVYTVVSEIVAMNPE